MCWGSQSGSARAGGLYGTHGAARRGQAEAPRSIHPTNKRASCPRNSRYLDTGLVARVQDRLARQLGSLRVGLNRVHLLRARLRCCDGKHGEGTCAKANPSPAQERSSGLSIISLRAQQLRRCLARAPPEHRGTGAPAEPRTGANVDDGDVSLVSTNAAAQRLLERRRARDVVPHGFIRRHREVRACRVVLRDPAVV